MISVLIATRNRGPELETQLRSFGTIEPPDGGWELLVIDNGSSDGTAPILQRVAAEGRLPLRALSEPRRGKSRALNLAVPAARGDLLAFTDDDAVVQPQWLRAFERAAARHPEAIGFAGRAPAEGGPAPAWHGIVNYEHGDLDFEIKPFETPPPGVNFAFRRRAFERYGLFREDLGPAVPSSAPRTPSSCGGSGSAASGFATSPTPSCKVRSTPSGSPGASRFGGPSGSAGATRG